MSNNPEDTSKHQALLQDILAQLNTVIMGKGKTLELTLVALISGGHILLEDVPGVGKTTLANALAHTIDAGFSRIQFTPDTLPSDVTGMSIYNMQTGQFDYRAGAIMNHIILADEINRTSPKTQASLLEAMEEKQVTVDGQIYALPQPFMVIATQNPVDYLGTYNLPEAQLDRFLLRLHLGYPSHEDEKQLVNTFLTNKHWKQLRPIASKTDILLLQQEVTKVTVHPDVINYLISIVEATRTNPALSLGASPRATLALMRAAQAFAYIKNRDFVIPDDLKIMAPHVLCHRLVLSAEAKLNKQSTEIVLNGILDRLKMPVL